MPASIAELLSTKITTGVISREAAANRRLLGVFGFNPGGANERAIGHRQFGYDIFNDTRTVMQARAPGVAAGTVTRQKVGRVDGVFPRFYEKLPLLAEELHNYRVIGGPSNVYDERGAQYIQRQQTYLGQRAGNNRMLLLMGLMRGKMYAHGSGDEVYYDFTSSGASFTIDWQTPANNLNQLNGLIDKSWADPSAKIVTQLRNVNARLQEAVGTLLEVCVTNTAIWNYVTNNDEVQAQAGIANPPWTMYEKETGVDLGTGKKQTVMVGRINSLPNIEWYITDEGLQIGGQASTTFTKYVDTNCVWWGPRPDKSTFEMLLGSEPINEGYGSPERVVFGLTGWTKLVDDPAGRMMFSLDNCIAANYIPNASGYATVVF